MLKIEERTLRRVAEQAATAFGEKEFVSFAGEEALTYGKVGSQIRQFHRFLAENNISKGDRIALWGSNMPQWVVCYLGITSYGAVAVPILPDFQTREVQYILEHSESSMLFVSDKLLPKFQEETAYPPEKTSLLETFQPVSSGAAQQEQEVFSHSTEPIALPPVEEDDLAVILYTSGTTGNSKGVMLSHKNLVSDAQSGFSVFRVRKEDIFLSILPLAHTYENTIGFLIPLIAGSRIHYLRKPPTANALLPALKQVRPTCMLSVPLVIEKIYKSKVLPTFRKNRLMHALFKTRIGHKILSRIAVRKLMNTFGGRLKFFGIGGAKLDSEVERFLRAGGFPYAVGYGLTETAPLIAGGIGRTMSYQSTGAPVNGVEIVLDASEEDRSTGEILVKGDNVMMGYYKNPELTDKVFSPQGYFRTGDLGFFDKNGQLHIKGRTNNMIVSSSGKNIHPEEIESLINKFKYVVESVVVEKKGRLVAMVHFNREEIEKQIHQIIKDARDLKEVYLHQVEAHLDELSRELQEYVNSNVNSFSRLQHVVIQPHPFEKTATQKIRRYLYS